MDTAVKTLNDEYNNSRAAGENQITTLLALARKFPYRLILQKVRTTKIILHN